MRNGLQKKVRQLDFETGEEINVYSSISEAARDNWIECCYLSHVLNYKNGIFRNRRLRFEYVN